MKPENNEDRKKLKWKFAGMYALSLLLLVLILSSFWGPLPSARIKGKKTPLTGNISQEHQVLLADDLLHAHINHLQQLDQKYIALLADSATGPGLKTIIKTITEAETAFSKSIDSIRESGKNYSQDNMRKFENLAASFSTLLDNRAFSNNDRSAGVVDNAVAGKLQSDLIKLKKELQLKDRQIDKLEKGLKVKQSNNFSYPLSPDDKLRQENDFLKLALRSQVSQTNSLKKNNDQLMLRIRDLEK